MIIWVVLTFSGINPNPVQWGPDFANQSACEDALKLSRYATNANGKCFPIVRPNIVINK